MIVCCKHEKSIVVVRAHLLLQLQMDRQLENFAVLTAQLDSILKSFLCALYATLSYCFARLFFLGTFYACA